MNKNIVEKHFDEVATNYDSGKQKYSFYYGSLKKLLIRIIGKGKTVFEFGCGTGDLLASLSPKEGYGMDISSEMIKLAKEKHSDNKNITFSTSMPKEKFDYIFMSDVIEHLEKPKETFKMLKQNMGKETKLIVTMANPIWEPLLMVWEVLGWKMKEGKHKRIVFKDIKNMIEELNMKVSVHDYELLMPIYIPFVTIFVNKYLGRILGKLSFIEYFVVMSK